MREPLQVCGIHHRLHGALVRVTLFDGSLLSLKQAEASSLSLALVAVRDKISPEREIYMSPIFSDGAFSARVTDDGLLVSVADGEIAMDWISVSRFAAELAAAIG